MPRDESSRFRLDRATTQARLSRADGKLGSARKSAEIDVEIAYDIPIGRADLYTDLAHTDGIIQAVGLALSPSDRADDTSRS